MVRWFRSRRRLWGQAALLALALQLGLSFVHLNAHAHHPSLVAASETNADAATPQQPNGDDDHESHYCAIYALLSGAQLATAPVIPAPIAPIVADVSTASAAVCLDLCHNAFRSRAPPLS